jgi:phosphatidylglycerophosphatase C
MTAVSDLSQADNRSIIAVFDFDGTLTHRDSLLPFLKNLVGLNKFLRGLLLKSPILIAYFLKFISNHQAKEALLTYFLSGRSHSELQLFSAQFVQQQLPHLLKSEAINRLHWHQEQGHFIVIVSASLELYLAPWAQTVGIPLVVGTQLQVLDDVVTGNIQGENCYGAEKIKRLNMALGTLSHYCIYAYGDSKGDRELLSHADYAFYRSFISPIQL